MVIPCNIKETAATAETSLSFEGNRWKQFLLFIKTAAANRIEHEGRWKAALRLPPLKWNFLLVQL
jgi:hypothetical protein